MASHALLEPVIALAAWTFVMWIWMYATRIPAMQKAQVDLDEVSRTGVSFVLPPTVSRVADNYNHLHEQPTLFYAIALSGAIAGVDNGIALGAAWAYVGIRILHSLIQATINKIVVRFGLFMLGSLTLLLLLVQVAMTLNASPVP